jgi:ADP-heptose:LPS heptosyltransferase
MCDLFTGPEGGMHHAAAATDLKAVVIFGGHISPDLTGYNFHKNLYVNDTQSPCGNKMPCDHCKKCLEKITPEMVIKEIKKII